MSCQPSLFNKVYIWLFNSQHCLVCDGHADALHSVCVDCEHELPWLGEGCQHCALPLPGPGMICADCIKHPPAFERVHAAWVYDFPVDSLIVRFKHHAKWPYGRLLAELLSQSLLNHYAHGHARPDLLLPVPLSLHRQRQRGFNQAAMLGEWLAQRLGIACPAHWLMRTQDTPAQQALDAKTRRRNLLHAFALAPQAHVCGRHLALVDDVLTTGATAQSLARLLLKAGAKRVDVYCLARTPKPDGPP